MCGKWSSPCSYISWKDDKSWSNYFNIQNDVLICQWLVKSVVSMQASTCSSRIFKEGSQLPEDSKYITCQILIWVLQLQMSFPPTFSVLLVSSWAELFLIITDSSQFSKYFNRKHVHSHKLDPWIYQRRPAALIGLKTTLNLSVWIICVLSVLRGVLGNIFLLPKKSCLCSY